MNIANSNTDFPSTARKEEWQIHFSISQTALHIFQRKNPAVCPESLWPCQNPTLLPHPNLWEKPELYVCLLPFRLSLLKKELCRYRCNLEFGKKPTVGIYMSLE